MKKNVTLLICLLTLLVGSTAKGQSCNAPVINSFSPNTGFIGSTVTITGSYFDPIAANNQVFFGATKATVVSSTFSSMVVNVPAGATYAPISVRNNCGLIGISDTYFNGIFCGTLINTASYNTVAYTRPVSGGYAMVSQDIDLDGKPELLVVGFTTNTLGVLRNLSTPGTFLFADPINLSVPSNTRGVTPADFDGDGKVDLAVTVNGVGIYVYRNLSTPGNISFAAPVTYTGAFLNGGTNTYQIASGDLNNDGKIDIAFTAFNQYVYILRNTSTGVGNISFQNPVIINNQFSLTGLAIADIDNDGTKDVATASAGNNTVSVVRNTTTVGSSTLTFASPSFYNTNSLYPYRLFVGDFDKDGKTDLVANNHNGATTSVFRNTSSTGNISFAPVLNLLSPTSNYRLGVGDADGDGNPDLVTKSSGENVFSVYKNTSNGPGSISFAPRVDYPGQAEVSGIVIADLDGDFVPDISTSGTSYNTLRIHRNASSIVDNTSPTALTKDITVPLNPAGDVVITPAMVDNGSSDACGIGTMSLDKATFTCADLGENVVLLSVTDIAGNVATKTAKVTIVSAAVIVAGQTTVCQGQTVELTANQGDSYQWFKDGVEITGANSRVYTATETGNYSVAVTNTGGCSGTSAPTAITVNNNPAVTTLPTGNASICAGGSVTITASEASVYQWYINNSPISGANQRTYNAVTAGTYTVRVIDLFGCSATSDPIVVNATDNITPSAKAKNITITLGENESVTINASDVNDGSSDNCGQVSLALSKSVFSCEDVGKVIPVTLTVTDGNSNSSTAIAQVTVTDPNSYCNAAPVAVGKEVTVEANENCNGIAEAALFDGGSTDEDGDELTFSVEPVGPYALGKTDVVLTVTDSKGASSTANASITVVDKTAPVLSVAPDDIIVYTGAEATNCTAIATWSALTAADNCASVTVASTHEPGSSFGIGTTTVKYTATDAAGNKAEKEFTVTVVDNTKPVITSNGNKNVYTDAAKCGAIVEVSATATDNCSVGEPIGVRSDGKTLSEAYPVGITTIKWNVVDAKGNSATEVIQTIRVTDNEVPVITTNGNKNVGNDSGICGAVIAVSASATDNCSVGAPTGVRSDGLALTAPYPVGTTTIKWNVTDANNNTATEVTQTVTVTNEAPIVTSVSAPLDPIAVNTPISIAMAYTDNNGSNAAINWGDGSVVENIMNPTNSQAATHTYSSPGVYTVKVKVIDACLEESNEYTYQYVVVYDPNGGFVTGGGWFMSPPGAHKTNVTAAGRANFGFVSKYQKGAKVPSGDTNFEFKAADLHFKSTSYEWLVVSGATARYKGVGTINGVGNYGFILSAIDGQVSGGGGSDKFRIKIWDKNNGDAMVYDNNLGDGADDAFAEMTIEGGSVVVHEAKKTTTTTSSKIVAATEPQSAQFYSYPTAFSTKTTIAFTLDKAEEYVLEVFDMKGALVKKLSAGAAAANKLYEIELDGTGMREGVYITRLTTASNVRSLKTVLKR